MKEWQGVFWVEPTFDDDGVQVSAGIDDQGREQGDPVPMNPDVGLSRPVSLLEQIKLLVRSEIMREAADKFEFDSPEEADDFYVEDDPEDPHTPYEAYFDPPARGAEVPVAPPVQGAAVEAAAPPSVNMPDASSASGSSDPLRPGSSDKSSS